MSPASASPLSLAASVFGALEPQWGWVLRLGLATRAAPQSRHGNASGAA
jgi:hypothetical protein